MRKGCLRYWERSAFGAEIVAQGATVLPSLVKAVLFGRIIEPRRNGLVEDSKTAAPRVSTATTRNPIALSHFSRFIRTGASCSSLHELHRGGDGEFIATFIFRVTGMATNQREPNLMLGQ